MEKILQKGIKYESNTYYKADVSRFDIYPEDCTCTNDTLYFSYTKAEVKSMPVGFFLKNLENITLDFGGADVVFHGKITPFILDNCKNVKLVNFKMDYDRPFYTQAHVLECDSLHMKVKIDDGFRYRVENGYLYAVSDTWEKNLNYNDCLLWLFDRTGQREYPIILGLFGPEIFPWENPPLPIGQILVEETDDGCLIFNGSFPESWDTNDGNNSLVFTHEARDKCSVIAINSEDIYINDFILVHGAAYAIMGMNCKNLYIDNFSMYMNYRDNGRLVTNNADGIHLFNCKGDFVFRNSYMDGLLDDTVNIHNNYLKIVEAEDDKLVCAFVGKAVTIECPVFVKGDRIAVLRGRTQEKKAEYVINQVVLDHENDRFIFTLDREISDAEAGDVIENLSGHPTILIENCEFGRFRGTMRLQSREKTIVRNCKFNNKGESIIFTGDTTYWYESGPVNDFLIENCNFPYTYCGPRIKFFGEVEYTEKEKYYHKNITVRNCYFDKGLVAMLNHVDGFVFEKNTSDGEIAIRESNCIGISHDESAVLIKD